MILLVAVIKTNKRLMNLDGVRGLEHKKRLVQIFLTFILEDKPQSFKEAVSSPEAPHWKEAIKSEI